ncbi:MAG: hypothetical protein R3D66_05085 [Alphaproteobacteria bacterium]
MEATSQSMSAIAEETTQQASSVASGGNAGRGERQQRSFGNRRADGSSIQTIAGQITQSF